MFNTNHQRYLLNQFRSIDKLFAETLTDLQPVDDGRLFVTHVADASVEQRQVLADYVAQLRFVLLRFMQSHELRDSHTAVSSLWSSRVALSFAATAVEELRPRYLRGYGEVDAESAAAIERLVADLHTALGRMANYLEGGSAGALGQRLAKLDATRNETELLKQLAQTIVKHGLVELRAPLERIVERLESPRFEVAVFGRVNSGKTSLLNWWLGQPLLPTGVLPVTAVPTKIVRGESAEARVTLAGADALIIPLTELASYVTEEGNPGNRKRVLDLEIRIPAPRLIDGLWLVDTPGLGSLAARGAALTLEYLPRCDLGVLLLEAGGAISRDDIDVARAIVDCGADLIVVLSKADRLGAGELSQALKYAEHRLSEELHFDVALWPISTLASHAELAETWFASAFESRLAAHEQQSAQAVRRKTATLREGVIALMQARMTSGSPQSGAGREVPATSEAALNAASEGRTLIAQVRSHVRSVALLTRNQLDDILDALTKALAESWTSGHQDWNSIQSRLRTVIAEASSATAEQLSDRLHTLLKELQGLLHEHWPMPLAAGELSPLRGRPAFEAATLILPANLVPPLGLTMLAALRRAAAYQRLAPMRSRLADRLAAYGDALQSWGMTSLNAWAAEFDAAVSTAEGVRRVDVDAEMSEVRSDELASDLAHLKEWPRGALDRP